MNDDEPILHVSTRRFVLFPIEYPRLWEFYKKAEASFWTAEEVDLQADVDHFANLTANEQHFVKSVLAFFAASDGIVLENVAQNFAVEVTIPEARAFYHFQLAIEQIHSETYSLLIDTLIRDKAERARLFDALETIPCIRKKADWAIRYMSSDAPFAQRLLAFAIVEGIFFSGSFCAVFWLKKRGLMPGLAFANSLISRDEGLHTDFACELYAMLRNKLEPCQAHTIVRDAVALEKEFICDALPCDVIGMNKSSMGEYIEFVADRLLVALNYDKLYHKVCPFDWMELISLQGKSNFFETRVAEYQLANVMNGGVTKFATDADF
jgi:ribonucleoside-diphosphate reductase subunit M2